MPRDVALVTLVAEREALTRRQITEALTFGSTTRANAILLRLVRHGYLTRRWQPTLSGTRRAVYLLGTLGRELVDLPAGRTMRFRSASDLFLEHRLVLNDVWLALTASKHEAYRLLRWLDEEHLHKLPLGLVPDGYVEYELERQSFSAFVEADLGTESLTRWQGKTKGYLQLAFSGQFERLFGRRFFRVFVVTTSERRLRNLRTTIAKQTDRVFWFTTREQLGNLGPFALIWSRPKDATLQSLSSP
jgi:DNA-binding PadR family transcriptional regulator